MILYYGEDFEYQGNRTDSGNYRRGGTETAFSGADAAKGQTYANGGTHMRLEEIKKELPETPDFIHRMIVEEVENQLGKKGTAVSIRTPGKRKWRPCSCGCWQTSVRFLDCPQWLTQDMSYTPCMWKNQGRYESYFGDNS